MEGRKKLLLFVGYFGNVISSFYSIMIVSNLLNKLLVYFVRLIVVII